jgi:hypothetical protein
MKESAGTTEGVLAGLVSAWDAVAGSMKALFNFSGDDSPEEEIINFTARFKEVQAAFASLTEAGIKANDAVALAEAESGLEGLEKSAAGLASKLDISVRTTKKLGEIMEKDLLRTMAEIEAIPIAERSDK